MARRGRITLERLARRIALGLPILGRGAHGSEGEEGSPGRRAVSLARYNRAYFRRWLLIGALIGVVAGVGAIVFYSAIAFVTQILLVGGAGFVQPSPASEGPAIMRPIARPWLIPVITTLGGLITGLIVFTLAPEAEGHGTDAAIEAFHHKNGYIRARIPVIKLVASAITIGSGGSAGREGPTAQISAGFGSWLATLLRLDDHDRRIAMAAGIGSGIGAIFKAPIGGAILSGEILYKRDFEADALFPSFIASVVGFSIYGAWAGWTPVFGAGGHFTFTNPLNLVGYLILGLTAGGVGLLYPKTLYGVRDFFARLRIPNIFKPAIGGLLVGLIGLAFPQALGMGYGYVQFGVNNDYVHLAAWLMLLLIFVKILTTSLTIGSGGSGGVFGPGMVIGGFLGGALWAGLHAVAPWMVAGTQPGAFVIVGMGAFFGGIAKAPLAVILMVAEMTGEYSLIVPAMLATMAAYLVTGDTSIYEKQVPTRLDSPAHRDDYALLLTGAQGALAAERVVAAPERHEVGDPMRRLRVADAMTPMPRLVPPTMPFGELQELVEEDNAVLVANAQGRAAGIVTQRDVRRFAEEQADEEITEQDGSPPAHKLTAKDVATRPLVTAKPDETLQDAVRRMSALGLRQLPVMGRNEATGEQRVVGLLRRSDALAAYVTTLAAPTPPTKTTETVAPTPSATHVKEAEKESPD